MNMNQSTNEIIQPMSAIAVLSHEEQRKLIRSSYQHPYGIFVRLPMFTGLILEELLALSWNNLNVYNSRLFVQKAQTPTDTESGIRQTNAPRFIPLLPHVLSDMLEWQETQRHACVSLPPVYGYRIPVTMFLDGHPATTESLQEIFAQILQISGIANYPFSVLRDTFAVRCLEQGMNPQTLSVILGDPDAANTYAQFKASREAANMAIMETLFTVQPSNAADIAYPIIITPQRNGCAMLYAPDFPETACYTEDLANGLRELRYRMEDDLHNSYYPPVPTPAYRIPCRPEEFVIQMCLEV